MRARVAALEAQHETRIDAVNTPGQTYNLITDIAETLAAEQPLLIHETRTATPRQTYTLANTVRAAFGLEPIEEQP